MAARYRGATNFAPRQSRRGENVPDRTNRKLEAVPRLFISKSSPYCVPVAWQSFSKPYIPGDVQSHHDMSIKRSGNPLAILGL